MAGMAGDMDMADMGEHMAEGMRRIHLLISNPPSSFLRRRGVEGGTGTDTDSSGISEDVIY
jgi:hypothetical protein